MVRNDGEHAPGDPQEQMEQMVSLAKGPKGDRGERGLPRDQAKAVVYLFLLAVLLSVLGIFWINHQAHATEAAIRHQAQQQQAAQAAQQRREQATQERAGEEIERKLCTTFGKLAALKPPAGNPVTNPARGYDQQVHAVLDGVGPDLECPR
jgi:uncharacterized protein HemX